MSLVLITDFNSFTNNFEDSTEMVSLKNLLLDSAQSVVEDYLGYQLGTSSKARIFSGIGSDRLYVNDYNILSVSNVEVDHKQLDSSSVIPGKGFIMDYLGRPVFKPGINNCFVEYVSGWTSSTLPPIIKLTILRIAALMFQETGGNIGLSGRNFADSSRSFVNYSDYTKYLLPLKPYRSLM